MRFAYLIPVVALMVQAGGSPARAGLVGEYFDNFTRPNGIITFDPADLVMTRVDANIDFWVGTNSNYVWQPVASGNWYGVRWHGLIRIDVAGDYAFGTVSDDGSQVWLDGDLIVDNGEEQWWDWEDSLSEGSFTGLYPENYGNPDHLPGPIHLDVGTHYLEVRFYEARYWDGIELWWLKPGSGASVLPYTGINFGNGGLKANAATNWQIVPGSVLETSVAGAPGASLPGVITSHGAAPNPFNPRTRLTFTIGASEAVTLAVYDVRGREVRRLVDGTLLSGGVHACDWDGCDRHGRPVPGGTYVYRLQAGGSAVSGKLLLVK